MTTPIDAQTVRANPFLLMLNPEAVFQAVEKSERLSGLCRHTCRPLDKAGPGEAADGSDGAALVEPTAVARTTANGSGSPN